MSEDSNRALKATRLYAHLRLLMDTINAGPVDASDVAHNMAQLSSDQWTGLAQGAGVNPPSTECMDVALEIAMVFVEAEEHFAEKAARS